MRRYTILIIDDEEDMLRFIEKILSPFYDIQKSLSVQNAYNILLNGEIELIICDVMMPGTDGYTFCKKIKSDIQYSHIPVILLTAKNTTKDKIDGLECGADIFMEKPFSKHHLIAQIESIFSNRIKVRDYFSNSPTSNLEILGGTVTDEQFFKTIDKVITDNMDDPQLGVEMLAKSLNMSRVTLYRKIVATTNLTPSELINVTRLKKAAALLRENKYKIYEVSMMVGYFSQSSFSRNFQKQFGNSPRDYIKSLNISRF